MLRRENPNGYLSRINCYIERKFSTEEAIRSIQMSYNPLRATFFLVDNDKHEEALRIMQERGLITEQILVLFLRAIVERHRYNAFHNVLELYKNGITCMRPERSTAAKLLRHLGVIDLRRMQRGNDISRRVEPTILALASRAGNGRTPMRPPPDCRLFPVEARIIVDRLQECAFSECESYKQYVEDHVFYRYAGNLDQIQELYNSILEWVRSRRE